MQLQEALLLSLLSVSAHAATASFCNKVKSVVTAAGASSAATAFCASYLHVPTSTVTSTSTPVTTTTVTTTTTLIEADSTITEVSTGPTTTETQTVATCPEPGSFKAKRHLRRSDPKPKPKCLSTYSPGAALSSACSCLSVPRPTTIVIRTAPKSTVKVTSTNTVVVAGSVHTSTTTVPGPTTTTYALERPSCGQVAADNGDYSSQFNIYYAGCGKRRSGPVVGTFTYSFYLSTCQAIQQCAKDDMNYSQMGAPNFAVFSTSSSGGAWTCTLFSDDGLPSPADFDVDDGDVLETYGYFQLTIDPDN